MGGLDRLGDPYSPAAADICNVLNNYSEMDDILKTDQNTKLAFGSPREACLAPSLLSFQRCVKPELYR